MKNFPNQASDLTRVRDTLEAIGHLAARGVNVLDDGILGYELANRQLYTFRGVNYSGPNVAVDIAARIPQEQAKPASNQGARTNAREMRRTLEALGWLDGSGQLTVAGQAFLATPKGSASEAADLAQALMQLEVTDTAGNTSHPVHIMLALLASAPSVHRDGLELCLEAVDDSPTELQRVLTLYTTPRAQRQTLIGATDTQVANAVKIFPALALQAGLVVENPPGTLMVAPPVTPSAIPPVTPPAIPPATPPPTPPATPPPTPPATPPPTPPAAPAGGGSPKPTNTSKVVTAQTAGAVPQPTQTGSVLTPEQQQRARELLAERTQTHQELVQRVASRIKAEGEMREDPFSYDLFWIHEEISNDDESPHPIVLMEMKTINGDAAAQVRRAVGQLTYYEYFQVRPEWPGHAVVRVAVFDAPIDSELKAYLRAERIDVMICPVSGPIVYERHSTEVDAPYALGLELM